VRKSHVRWLFFSRRLSQSLRKLGTKSSPTAGEMMFRYLGWGEAPDLIIKGLNGASR
jgi:isocitrate dehydrogenase